MQSRNLEKDILLITGGFAMKKILFVASEGVPFIKTGGLADVVVRCPSALTENTTMYG